MNIHDFEEQISPEIMKKARKLAERNMTTTLNVYTDGTYECWLRDSEPGYYYGNHVEVVLSDSGELEYSRCDRLCREEYCVHKSALMIIVKERFDKLLELVQEISTRKTQKDVGTTQQVLVEEINQHDAALVTGRTSQNYLVHFPGEKELIGKLVNVHLTESKGFYYMGELVEERK